MSGCILRDLREDDGGDFVPFTNLAVSGMVAEDVRVNECVAALHTQSHVPAGYGHERADAGPIEHIPLPHAPVSVKPRSKWKKQPWKRRRWAQDGYR